jgi:uncharacterized membrane protein YagU involved in acid resistance
VSLRVVQPECILSGDLHARAHLMTRLGNGVLAGLVGTTAMVGVITTLRRSILDTDQLSASLTHPEKIVQRLGDLTGLETFDDRTRRRAGDVFHFGYGALAGAAFACSTRSREVRVVRDGGILGLGLWAFGFNVLLPALRAHPGAWTWERREFVLTLSAHAAYGFGTAATLRLLRANQAR